MDFPEDAGVKFPSMFGIWVVNYIIVNAIPSDLYSHKVDKKQRSKFVRKIFYQRQRGIDKLYSYKGPKRSKRLVKRKDAPSSRVPVSNSLHIPLRRLLQF